MPRAAGSVPGPPGAGGSAAPGPTVGEVGERGILEEVFAALRDQPAGSVLVGPGDDTALLAVRRGSVLTTTDTMVRGEDWRDEWSTAFDVGTKAVTQNLADLASMGGVGTGLLVTLVAERSLPLSWVGELMRGLAWAAGRAGVPVVGGDLSAAGDGVVAISLTALGELGEGVERPVLRSGARAGDVLAVSGRLGRSGAGLELLRRGHREGTPVDHHRRPLTDLGQGPAAARAGATAMIDVSDGLVRDADRVARASGVVLELDEESVLEMAGQLVVDIEEGFLGEDALGEDVLGVDGLGDDGLGEGVPLTAVLRGGEEHELLATFPAGAVPPGWSVLGRVVSGEVVGQGPGGGLRQGFGGGPGQGPGGGPGVRWRGELLDPSRGGWDHFGG